MRTGLISLAPFKVDPSSPRAEELRRLLEVVAGTAPDEDGRWSGPMVKDERAIVDFLTQRASTGSDVRSSAPIPPYSHVMPSHRNAPSMLSRRKESATRTMDDMYTPTVPDQGKPSEDPAWSFVAPELASLDVHQPFGEGSQPSRSRQGKPLPKPLAAPSPRGQRNPHNIPPWEQAGWQNPYATPAVHPAQSLPMLTPQAHDIPIPGGASSHAGSDSMQNSDLAGMDQGSAPSTEIPMTTADWADWDNWWSNNQATLGTPMPANSSTTGEMGFNPFALSQFHGQTENPVEDAR